MAPARGAIVFVERYAHELNGHAPAAVLALAGAATAEGLEAFVVVPRPLPRPMSGALAACGARVVHAGNAPSAPAKLLHALELAARNAAEYRARRVPGAPRAPQLWLFARSFGEAAAVRAARSLRADGTIVILTGCETLVGFSSLLGRHRHVRIVHDVCHPEGRVVRAVERASTRGRRRSAVWCTTDAVARALCDRYGEVSPEVHPFAVVEPGHRITETERAEARRRLGLGARDTVATLVGGWQPYKDPLTALEGLARSRRRLTVVVAGHPIDSERAAGFTTSSCRVVPLPGPREPHDLRAIYAAATFTVVSRVPGVARESGLVMDAAKFGVPLVTSDHDPELLRRVAGAPWVRAFRAGDPSSLARVVDELELPWPRPPESAPALLGMSTASEMVRRLSAAL